MGGTLTKEDFERWKAQQQTQRELDLESRLNNLEARIAALESKKREATNRERPKDLQEVAIFFTEAGLTTDDASFFWDKMQASGWRNDGKVVKCWKSTVRVWARLKIFPSQKQQPQSIVSAAGLEMIIKRKEQEAAAFKDRHTSTSALGVVWNSEINHRNHQVMIQAISKLKAQQDAAMGVGR